jgi:carboxyl-terminal processing protease
MERQKNLVALLALLTFGLGVFAVGFLVGHGRAEPNRPVISVGGGVAPGQGGDVLKNALEEIRRTAVDPPSEEQLVRGALRGMAKVLKRVADDPYALYYSPQGYEDFQELTTGRFSGIGVWIKPRGGELEIVSLLPRTPAVEAGLRRGDVITSVDGAAVADMTADEAVARIKGREGTEVTIGITRDDEDLEFTIERASIALPNLKASLTSENVGYIRLFGFARGAADQVRDRVDGFVDAGAQGIVLDLRDNGGGLFPEAIDVASIFIEDGKVVRYKERAGDEVVYDARGDAYEDVPVVVLVNEGTASASEIVAGAMQDHERAVLVGTTTYGKGSVQEIVPLLEGSAMKMTTAAYYTPEGRDIDGQGIEPDVEVAGGYGEQRRRAMEILEGIILSTTGGQG